MPVDNAVEPNLHRVARPDCEVAVPWFKVKKRERTTSAASANTAGIRSAIITLRVTNAVAKIALVLVMSRHETPSYDCCCNCWRLDHRRVGAVPGRAPSAAARSRTGGFHRCR